MQCANECMSCLLADNSHKQPKDIQPKRKRFRIRSRRAGLRLARSDRPVKAIPTAPVGGLSSKERPHRTDVALMAEEVGLLLTLGPEADGIRESVHGLSVSADEGSAEVDVLDAVFLGLEVGNLTDIITRAC